MRKFQIRYTDRGSFEQEIRKLSETVSPASCSNVVVHIYAECWCYHEAEEISRAVHTHIPNAVIVGAASFGNICKGKYTRSDVVVTVSIFDRGSQAEVFFFPITPEQEEASIASFLEIVRQRPWVKAVEAFIMADVPEVTHWCDAMQALPEQIEFFGGKSRFDHAKEAPKFVIDNDGKLLDSTAAIVLYGGEELYIKTGLILGWKPLGRAMKATRYHGDVLCELDGKPAHSLYYKYLHIDNDENFFFKTLEFPFLFYKDGESVMRISHACLEDGSMVLGASIPECDYVRIAFGDTNAIMNSVLEGGREFEEFRPDAIELYSCGCRRTFWGDEESNKETEPFEGLAPTSGYYTAGELLRENGKVTEHNSTLVVAAMREGPAEEKPAVTFQLDPSVFNAGDSLINRFSFFVAAAIEELEEANKKLEKLSITDGLTGLLNRREIEHRIRMAMESGAAGITLIMMDLDSFKSINDRYSHMEGDLVLRTFAAILHEFEESNPHLTFGRWGGEEFIGMMTDESIEVMLTAAENIRKRFASVHFEISGFHSVSIGITSIQAGESTDAALNRVDAAWYEAKSNGKNQVKVLEV